mmetsp:Transcript_5810/g.12244  ORF Transcript_5810/g.12244 Transcript_5810/m.12244 type:complete len:208 (+) Transcript_5810:1436-2059(+)
MIKILKTRVVFFRQSGVVAQIIFDVHVEFSSRNSVIAINIRLFEFVVITLKRFELMFGFCLFQRFLVLLHHILQLLVLLCEFVDIIVILTVKLFLFFLELGFGFAQHAAAVELGSCEPAQCPSKGQFRQSWAAPSSTFLFLTRSIILIQIILRTVISVIILIIATTVVTATIITTTVVVVVTVWILGLPAHQNGQRTQKSREHAPSA